MLTKIKTYLYSRNWKGFFIHVGIIVASALLTALIQNLEPIRTALTPYINPEVLGPMFALLGSFLKILLQGVNTP